MLSLIDGFWFGLGMGIFIAFPYWPCWGNSEF